MVIGKSPHIQAAAAKERQIFLERRRARRRDRTGRLNNGTVFPAWNLLKYTSGQMAEYTGNRVFTAIRQSCRCAADGRSLKGKALFVEHYRENNLSDIAFIFFADFIKFPSFDFFDYDFFNIRIVH